MNNQQQQQQQQLHQQSNQSVGDQTQGGSETNSMNLNGLPDP
jgi:hypothetical protein